MRRFRIAIIPGDGIGPEVTAEAVRVLDELESSGACAFDTTTLPWGYEHLEQRGAVVPDDFLDQLRDFDAILLGAMGWPDRAPDSVTLEPLVKIRQAFDQYACVRPVKLYAGVKSPLADKQPEDIDFVVIRENSEGEYIDAGGRFRTGRPGEVAIQTAIHTRKGVERILRFGIDVAIERCRHLTVITKSNAQRYGYVLWDEVLDELREEFPEVEVDKQHADAAAMNFVRSPEQFDVVVASNLFGDILTDLGGIIAGGLGLSPSTNTNPQREFPSMFEPVHGSAPDIAGQGIANPVAAILSAAMMLDWLRAREAAEAIRHAVEATLAAGLGTPDLGGELSTREMGEEIVGRMKGEDGE